MIVKRDTERIFFLLQDGISQEMVFLSAVALANASANVQSLVPQNKC